MPEGKIHFKGLNGLRAMAAIGVVIKHFGLHSFGEHPYSFYAVTMFFTLSGFLITFLLFAEKEATGKINFKNFYLRRILRIWPIYFLYIALVFMVHSYIIADGIKNAAFVLFQLFLLPNIANAYNRFPQDTSQLWSIGIEEQFYAFWPFVMRYVKKITRFLIGLILFLPLLRILFKFYADFTHNTLPLSILIDMKYDCMAIGAFFAISYYHKEKFLMKWGTSFLIPVLFWCLVIMAVFYRIDFFSVFTNDVVSIISGLFIIYLIRQDKKLSFFENPLMSFLGQISYGIYIYHRLILSLTKWFLLKYTHQYSEPVWIISSLSITILIAFLSYRFFEMPFLRLKNKFAIIKSSST
jgi:peptidoglycan/LPS O-acetylase OafA/YrhL